MKILFAGLLGIAVAGFTPSAAAEKVRLTGEQLTEMLAGFYVRAGMSPSGYAFMGVSEPGGKRELYWNAGQDKSAVWKGQSYVEGDKLCNKYEQRTRCNDVFQLADGSFEFWRNGKLASAYRVIKTGK